MTEYLMTALPSLSIVLLVLLVCRRLVLRMLGSGVSYTLWALVPISVIFAFIPKPEAFAIPLQIQHYSVSGIVPKVDASLYSWASIFSWSWGIGFAILALAMVILHVNHANKLKQSFQTIEPKALENVKSLGELKDNRLLMFRSKKVHSPILSGFWKQILVIPQGFEAQYTPLQQKLILAHENYHYGRFDIYWNYFAMFLLLVFWFHPLAWLAYFRYRQDQELSCDHAILVNQSIESRQQYAHALVNTLERQSVHFAYLSFGKFGDKNMMLERLEQLKNVKSMSKFVAPLALLTGVLTMTVSIGASEIPESSNAEIEKGRAQLTKLANPIFRLDPSYPEAALKENLEGYVVLSFGITPNGTVENIKVIDSEPADYFDIEAKKALARWRYEPHDLAENPISTVQLEFTLVE